MAAEQSTCSACGSTDLEDDTTHGVVACSDCGAVQEGQLTDRPERLQVPAATFSRPQERSKEQIRMFSEKGYAHKKESKLVKETVKMAEAMKLSRAKSNICVEQAKELNKRGAVGRSLNIHHVAAALVYIAWKSDNSSVSAWDMGNMGIKPHALLKTTKKLCAQHSDLVSITQSEPLTDKERLNLRLDRFSLHLTPEERKRVLAIAQDMWSMVINVKVQELNIRKIPINDYCLLAVAIQNVKRKKLPKTVIAKLSENLSMTACSIETRIWVIRKALLTLASRCPCLEEDVKDRVITTQTVVRYLDRIIQNKEYLASEMEMMEGEGSNEGAGEGEREGGDDDEESAGKKRKKRQRKRTRQSRTRVPTGPVVLADGEGGQDWGEEEARLSELDSDIDEYILTEQEVEFRRHLSSSTGNLSP